MKTLTLKKTIPSGSHNAPYSMELGNHWPAGQQFRLLPKRRQNYFNKIALEQVGGEEVILLVPEKLFGDLFGNQSGESIGEFLLIIFAVIAASAIAWTFAGYPATVLLGTLAELVR